jgi:hypothetical protein
METFFFDWLVFLLASFFFTFFGGLLELCELLMELPRWFERI